MLAPIFGDYDVLLAASAAGEAPIGWDPTTNVPLHIIWSILYAPVMTLPVFNCPNGLLIGAQLIAKRHDDRRLFAAAR